MLIDKDYNWTGKTLLIAEDEEINYIFIERVLMSTNATIIRAGNGRAAIDIATNNKNINLIMMDLRMPEVNGIEAASAIKKIRPDLPIIAQTCYDNNIDLSAIDMVKFDGFVSKPININKMLELIDKFVKPKR